ncbi:MAG: hypothetical protein QG610_694, partial [Euryarchaeota archaeon]|nr:hypothetical protein [Euryarchaeota archaeon]
MQKLPAGRKRSYVMYTRSEERR